MFRLTSRLPSCRTIRKFRLARWQLAELLGAGDELPSDAMLEMSIARLRKKLTAAGAQAIRTAHKRGYVLSCELILE